MACVVKLVNLVRYASKPQGDFKIDAANPLCPGERWDSKG